MILINGVLPFPCRILSPTETTYNPSGHHPCCWNLIVIRKNITLNVNLRGFAH